MFLVEKLPKAETEATETVMGMKHLHVCILSSVLIDSLISMPQ